MDGTYFTNHYAADDTGSIVQDFVKTYRQLYDGETPDAMAVLGYDAARILFDAISRAGSEDPPKIRDALAATRDFVGVSGRTTIDAERNARKAAVIVKIENGQFRFHSRVYPS
jgi:branched-chain amino acid transport system substrate-binding protein